MAEFLQARDERKILHVDLDAFYAQVEMRDNPALKTVPLIIGRDPDQHHGHGVVATANYLARQAGVHSAMGSIEAKRACPNAVFVAPDFDKYRQISAQIHAIFAEFTDVMEPVALDEAYLDVTANPLAATTLAAKLRHRIWQETKLTCSVGVSYNKVLAKLGSEHHKPNGVTVITPAVALDFVAALPIKEFRGVGKKAQEKFEKLGIQTGADLRAMSQDDLRVHFGSFGDQLYWQARATHFGQVKDHRVRQSLGKESTFEFPLHNREQVLATFKDLATKVVANMEKKHLVGRTLNIKVRDDDYQTQTRAVTQSVPFNLDPDFLARKAQSIFDDLYPDDFAIRLLGITFSNVSPQAFQPLSLFDFEND
ncbi:DNA polymerase IV [Fructobacillus pseudoficulneus]|uniref:DNA polymerase IV n=1 Tax=Fructobacillus pseudoficulneus TaxID=220714 RepID=A0A3F3H2K0_9LACO|nr:DNA polymerase IV [Fructobacillus pseudoficulneus]GAP02788.1 DNA polymerase IV [Fructobacillus pseudoficulneus]SEH39906.1 DNA polymerase-4 [Fructobacillus pseudoficulneus]